MYANPGTAPTVKPSAARHGLHVKIQECDFLAHSQFALQERSKPIEPPKKPEAAPFFLPTVAGVERDVTFDVPEASDAAAEEGAGMPGWGADEQQPDGSCRPHFAKMHESR